MHTELKIFFKFNEMPLILRRVRRAQVKFYFILCSEIFLIQNRFLNLFWRVLFIASQDFQRLTLDFRHGLIKIYSTDIATPST